MVGTLSLCPLHLVHRFLRARTMPRRCRHRERLVLRRHVHRPIAGHRVHAVDGGLVNDRAFRNQPRLGVRDVVAEMRLARRPFLVLRALRQIFEQPPRAGQRSVQFALDIGLHIRKRAALALDAPGELVDVRRGEIQPAFAGLVDHPEQRIFGKPAFLLRIPAADIGMHAGEPHLQNILRRGVHLVEADGLVRLRLVPLLQAEHGSALVDRDRLAERLHARVLQRPGQFFQARPVEPIRPRHDHARDRIPDADEADRRPARRRDARELGRVVERRGRQLVFGSRRIRDLSQLRAQLRRLVGGELLVGDQPRAGEIDLLRRDEPDLVDQPRQHPHGIGAAGEAEQIDLVVLLPVVDQEGIGREHVVIEPIAGGEPEDRVEILLELVPRIRPRQRADPRIVIDELPRLCLLGLAQAAIELEHIGNVLGNFVAGAVAADDDVAHGGLAEYGVLPWRA